MVFFKNLCYTLVKMKNIIILIALFQFGCASDNYYYKNNQKVSITPNTSISRSDSSMDYYENEKGIVLGVTDKLIVKLKDTNSLQKYLNKFNLTLEKTLTENLYLLKVENRSLTIDISNRLNEKEDVKYAHPDFIKKRMSR